MEKKWMIAGGVAGVLVVAMMVGSIAMPTFAQGSTSHAERLKAVSAESYNPTIDPSEFTTEITNKYFSLPVGKKMVYEAETEEGLEKIQIEILDETKTIMGVKTLVFWDRVWLDGELIEDTRDYLAQDKEGNVWYFGEDVDNYEDGKLKDHAGAWIAGIDGAKPGIWMKANPQVGDSYRQEYYKGEAEDMAEVLATNETVTTPYDTFKNCVKTLEWSPLAPDLKAHKYYSPEVGGTVLEVELVGGERKVEERVELVSAESYNPTINPSEFTTEITNKYFSLPVGKKMVYEAQTEDGLERIEILVPGWTREIMGVKTLVFWDRVYLDGELIEDTRDYLAQHKETGDVWYFGEHVDNYEGGELIDHHGAWFAGVDGAKPGIWVLANPKVGDYFRNEYLIGEAEDESLVVGVGETVTTPYGTFTDCVKYLDGSPLFPQKAYTYHCKDKKVRNTVAEIELDENMDVDQRVELVSVDLTGAFGVGLPSAYANEGVNN